MAKMKSRVPARKVTAATIGAAVVGIVIWYLNTRIYADLPDQKIPEGIAALIETVVVAALGYFVPASPNDQVVT